MRTLLARLRRAIWLRRAVRILTKYPFNWTEITAASYANGIYHLYLEEGFSPAEAIECDRQYWET